MEDQWFWKKSFSMFTGGATLTHGVLTCLQLRAILFTSHQTCTFMLMNQLPNWLESLPKIPQLKSPMKLTFKSTQPTLFWWEQDSLLVQSKSHSCISSTLLFMALRLTAKFHFLETKELGAPIAKFNCMVHKNKHGYRLVQLFKAQTLSRALLNNHWIGKLEMKS